jgi:pyrimidine operon attenuation protein/uracil phosphoribosyltransferase
MSGNLSLDAEALYRDLLRALQPQWGATDRLVGITSGGAWLAERLQADLGLSVPAGVISSAMHRDDFARRGLADGGVTRLPFEIEGAHLWIIDDVLYTGRTVRAVINELYDYGRPASVRLAVLVDRGGHELPIQADCAAARLSLPADQKLSLQRGPDGRLSFSLRG